MKFHHYKINPSIYYTCVPQLKPKTGNPVYEHVFDSDSRYNCFVRDSMLFYNFRDYRDVQYYYEDFFLSDKYIYMRWILTDNDMFAVGYGASGQRKNFQSIDGILLLRSIGFIDHPFLAPY